LGGRFSELSEPGVTPPYEEPSADACDPTLPNTMASIAMIDCFPTVTEYATEGPDPKLRSVRLRFRPGQWPLPPLSRWLTPSPRPSRVNGNMSKAWRTYSMVLPVQYRCGSGLSQMLR